MRRIVTVAICALLLGAFATSTFAGSALGMLRGFEDNVLEDEDFEAIIIKPGDTWLPVNLTQVPSGTYVVPNPQIPTILLSMWNVQQVSYATSSDVAKPTTNTFTAISATKVNSVSSSSSVIRDAAGNIIGTQTVSTVTFVPLTSAEWSAITGSGGFLPAGAAPTGTGSFGIMFDDSVLDNSPSWIHPDLDEATENDGVAFHPEDWAADFGTALGTKLWEFGFTGTNGAAQNGEFWVATITNNTGVYGPSTVSFLAGLNETYSHIAHPALLPHDGFSFNTGNLYEFELSGNIPYSTIQGDGFYATDTDIMIRPTPEPGSLALLGLGLAACGVIYRRRRNK